MRIITPILFCASLTAAAGSGCNESLPLHSPPADVLTGTVKGVNGPQDTVRYRMKEFNNPNLTEVSLSTPPFSIEITLVNIYEETIQDLADVQGVMELEWIDKIQYSASIPLTASGIVGGQYDPVTGLITLNPGESISIRVFWNYKLTTNEWAFTKQQADESEWVNTRGDFYRYHYPMRFRSRVRIKLFRSLSFLQIVSADEVVVNFQGFVFHPADE